MRINGLGRDVPFAPPHIVPAAIGVLIDGQAGLGEYRSRTFVRNRLSATGGSLAGDQVLEPGEPARHRNALQRLQDRQCCRYAGAAECDVAGKKVGRGEYVEPGFQFVQLPWKQIGGSRNEVEAVGVVPEFGLQHVDDQLDGLVVVEVGSDKPERSLVVLLGLPQPALRNS